MNTGIYCIENIVNGKKYIGQSIELNHRWGKHVWGLNNNKFHSTYFVNSWNKYGIENFKFYIIEECDRNILNERETFWIKELNTLIPNGYNANGGGNARTEVSKETRMKISKSSKSSTPEVKAKISKANKGRKISDEAKRKMSDAKIGKPLSEEHRKTLSIAHMGRIFSEETKKLIGDGVSGLKNYRFGIKNENSSSKYFGVRLHIQKQNGKEYVYWGAYLKYNGKTTNIGNFKEEINAAKAYDKYVIENNLPHPLNFKSDGGA